MRICLLTGGGYPYRRDALGGWCRTLVTGLGRHSFHLITLTDRKPPAAPAYPLPANVASARAIAYAGPVRRRGAPPGDAAAAAILLCRGLLDDGHRAGDTFTEGLRWLSALASADDAPLAGVPLADALLDAWRAGRAAPAVDRMPLPRLCVRDARTAATLLRHVSRALSVRVPDADLLHCVGGTTPLLAALAVRWRTGTPLLLTEARAPVTRHRPAEERLSPVIRTILRRFRRAVARTGYAEAGLIAPLSTYHHGWAMRHGAQPERLVAVPAGVNPRDYPAAPDPPPPEPPTPEPPMREPPTGRGTGASLVWTGSGAPDSGLDAVLEAFAIVVDARPGTVLHLTGITDGHREACTVQVACAGLAHAVRMHAPVDEHTAGEVVVHRAGPGDPPYRLIEAMMAGRPVVAADVGPVAETLGDAGVLVPADDPAAVAASCVALLGDPARRRELGDAARRRALARFTADRVVRAYDALYTDLAGPPPPPVYELALAVPAPRAAQPHGKNTPNRIDPPIPATLPDPGHPWSGRRGLAQEER